jgi:hypothetical protein
MYNIGGRDLKQSIDTCISSFNAVIHFELVLGLKTIIPLTQI